MIDSVSSPDLVSWVFPIQRFWVILQSKGNSKSHSAAKTTFSKPEAIYSPISRHWILQSNPSFFFFQNFIPSLIGNISQERNNFIKVIYLTFWRYCCTLRDKLNQNDSHMLGYMKELLLNVLFLYFFPTSFLIYPQENKTDFYTQHLKDCQTSDSIRQNWKFSRDLLLYYFKRAEKNRWKQQLILIIPF